ncbi:MAG TPA: hypothetical protein VIF35_06965 [Streptosporangiaceae bacterium]
MAYPDQKHDQDHIPVEDAERPVGDDQAVAGHVIEPDEDRMVDAETGEPVRPAGEGAEDAGPHRYTGDELDALAAEDDQVVLESSEAGPVTAGPAGQNGASATADAGPDRVGEAIPMPSGSAAGEPRSARAADSPAGPADVTHPDPVPVPSGANGDDHDWREVMAMFVDDPRAATERAARMVDGSVEDLVRSLKGEQDSLRSAWQGGSADTERLRTALKDYRSFWQRLDGFAHRV